MRILKFVGRSAPALLAATVSMPVNAGRNGQHPAQGCSGKAVGDVDLVQTGSVLIKLQLKGLTPGEHAFHVHAVGKCEARSNPPAAFHPGNHKHGIMSAKPRRRHANLHVPQSGELSVEVVNSAISLEKASRTRCSTTTVLRS